MGVINCCLGCKPPKRSPYCHSSCQEYLAEKAEYEQRKQKAEQQKQLGYALDNQRITAIHKAWKKWRIN